MPMGLGRYFVLRYTFERPSDRHDFKETAVFMKDVKLKSDDSRFPF